MLKSSAKSDLDFIMTEGRGKILHQRAEVLLEIGTDAGGWEMEFSIAKREFSRLLKEEPLFESRIQT
ncbi:hypothetical protein [endosymbiont of Lamellibrachia barhami]|uniref:hypothetical protein n=1 Tax=endosymbiont of Lamellibrachia barhami TaxID=205975 RepID=UPI0015AD2E24|nr:hypothetical protein [endosymbiont of Lamellibrachia barhami]